MHKSVQLLSVLIVVALAFVASACGSKEGRVCSHLESLAEGDMDLEEGESCADSISELEEACPDMYGETLDCVLEADNEGDAGVCLLACAMSQLGEMGE